MSLCAYVDGIGILGPGLCGWRAAASVLTGSSVYAPAATLLPAPALLPPAERRRTGRVVKLALAVALEATEHAGSDPAGLPSVFSSSGADGHNCHEICLALAGERPELSPTRFANSVHNASAGYWSIATGAKFASNVLCAFDASFGAGLLEAMVQASVERQPVLMVAYDTEYPDPLHAKRRLPDAFGVALVLRPERGVRSLARLTLELALHDVEAPLEAMHDVEAPLECLPDPRLDVLAESIPAARGLPLLRRLALPDAGIATLAYLDSTRLRVAVDPCPERR